MANDKPQVWHGKANLLLWIEPSMDVITTIEDDPKSYTYCNRDDVEGFDADDKEKIKDKVKEKNLKVKYKSDADGMLEDAEWRYEDIDDEQGEDEDDQGESVELTAEGEQ